jgi:arabinosaccharide transport system substrate-binding protein
MLFTDSGDYFRWFANSLILTVVQVAGTLLVSSFVAYGFAMYEFKGKTAAFIAVLLLLTVPFEMLMFPLYVQVNEWGLSNTYTIIVLPFLASAVTIFFFRQYLRGIPKDILEAGRLDGVSEFGIFFRLVLPISKPALAAGTAFALLAACSSGGSPSSSSTTSEAAPAPAASSEAAPEPAAPGATTLQMWVFAELHAAFYEDMADKWNAANPDRPIDLQITVYPYEDMHNKLQLAVNSGQGLPDIADIEVNKFANFTKGSNPPLLDLTEAAAPYKADIVQARLDLYSKDGKILGFPTHVGAFVAFYNTELLEGAGIDYTTIVTWDDFQAAGAKYHEATGKNFGIASTGVFFQDTLIVAQLGGNIFDIFDASGNLQLTSPEVIQAFEIEKAMQDAGAVATIAGGSPDSEEAFGAINNGDYAAVVYPAWYTSRYVDYMPDLAGKVAIAPAPVTEGAKVKTIGGGGTGTSVMAASPNKDLAADYVAYAKLSEDANIAVWEVLGFDPVNMAVWEDEAITKNPDNKFNKYFQNNLFDVLNSVKDSIGHFQSFSDPNWPPVDSWFRTVTLNEIFENGTPVAQALEQAQADLKNDIGQ